MNKGTWFVPLAVLVTCIPCLLLPLAAVLVASANPGCAMHLARGAAERGLDVQIVHLVELLARAYPPNDDHRTGGSR